MLFCGNDLFAMGAMSALEKSGVRFSEDVSVIGINDIFFAFAGASSFDDDKGVPREQLGIKVCEALERMLKLKRRKGLNYTLERDPIAAGRPLRFDGSNRNPAHRFMWL